MTDNETSVIAHKTIYLTDIVHNRFAISLFVFIASAVKKSKRYTDYLSYQ